MRRKRSDDLSAEKEVPLKILFVASECAPYAKSGGLGDVVGALPKELADMGHQVQILMPLYRQIDQQAYDIRPDGAACIHMGEGIEHWVGIFKTMLTDRVPVWFLDFSGYYNRPGIYDGPGGEYGDNAYRFAMLSKAALQLCKDRNFIPHVMHLHDWPTAITSVLLKTWDRVLSPLSATASVLTIHNIGYQGVYDASAFPYFGIDERLFHRDVFEDFGRINLLKAGIVYADAITTVSPNHAQEILGPIGGQGLAPYLANRAADLTGILNGADYEHWNPEIDPFIPARYSAEDLSGKKECKRALQRRFNLHERDDVPLLGVVSRFAPQKGFHLLQEVLPGLLNQMDVQFVVLGTGDNGTQDFFNWLATAYPGRAGAHIGFSVELSHLIEAGSDFFLMPSLYEPCGLNQIYSMRYGTLPIVRATGGLDDTVENYDEISGDGTGFKFHDPSADALYNTIGWAVSTWYDRPDHIRTLQAAAMQQRFSWEVSAREYVEVYRNAIRHRAARG